MCVDCRVCLKSRLLLHELGINESDHGGAELKFLRFCEVAVSAWQKDVGVVWRTDLMGAQIRHLLTIENWLQHSQKMVAAPAIVDYIYYGNRVVVTGFFCERSHDTPKNRYFLRAGMEAGRAVDLRSLTVSRL